MEKKYYFRGLGLGIIVTAVIMGIALSGGSKREMTDNEVIARAKELGMTENTRLLEPAETDESQEGTEPSAEKEPVKKDVAVAQPKDGAEETSKADGTESSNMDEEEPSDEEQPAGGEESKPQEKPAEQSESAQDKKPAADTNEMTKQDEDTEQKAPSEEASSQQTTAAAASVTIISGDGSYTVARKLEEAGVVSSASAYDDFLCQNGYDKRLRTGTFQIPAGASDEQIAKIVTSQP